MTISAMLLSGGVDSSALAFWLRPQLAFTIDYGQRPAEGELRAARQIAKELGLYHEVIAIDGRHLGSGDLAGRPAICSAPASDWWPYRNQLLLTLSAMRAVALDADRILIGTVATDNMYSDGSEEFMCLFDQLMAMQERGLRVVAPGIKMTSVDLVRKSGITAQSLA